MDENEHLNVNENENTNKISVIIYYSYIYKIGGIESWIYNMCQQLCNYYDIKVMFDDGNIEQLKRINEYVIVERRNSSDTYNCDVLLVASHLNKYPNNIKCKKCISVVHSDYEYYKDVLDCDSIAENANEIVSVSNKAAKSLNSVTGRNCKIISNILGKKVKPNKVLHLVSFTRLSPEKGYERMCFLVKKLKDNNIKFDWKIFSDIDNKQLTKLDYPEIIFMNPTLDKYDYLSDADYLVQLSDTEAFCYSVHESLQYGTPVLVTDLDVFKDVVIDGYNGYNFKLDMSNVTDEMIYKIVNNIPTDFIYNDATEEIIDKWFDIIGEPKYTEDVKINNKYIKVQAIEEYYDLQQYKNINVGDTFDVTSVRAYELCTTNNYINRPLCKVIGV